MGGNYEKGMYNQLMEVMARLDAVEKDLHSEKAGHREDVDRLNSKIDALTQENHVLRNDNARLRSIINNDSTNSSLPPSSDQKAEGLQTLIMAETKQGARQADRKGEKEPL